MAIYALGDRTPTIDPSAYVHPDATVIGDVEIGPEATVWAGAVLRGDYGRIVVGARTSVQDGTVVHATHELSTVIGSDCVVGHNAHLEGCRIEPHSLVGSGSIVLHRCVVGPHSLVGANAVVTNGTVVPPHAQALGIPAKIKTDSVQEGQFAPAVALYVANGKRYRAELRRLD
jgi:carbonic anhydrase/acetyltransferase-like protein (isoleucine patch superfamily)